CAAGLRGGALKTTSFAVASFAACVALAPSACSRPPPPAPAPARSDEAPRWPSQDAGARLPEDPASGRRAEEQWKGHLAQEDRERQLARDRHAIAEHEAIVALLVSGRREADRARGRAGAGATSARVADVERQVEQHLARINVWGNVSPLTATYRSMVAS